MRRVEHALHVPNTPGEGDGQDCSTYVDKWVEFTGAYTGSVKVQGLLRAGGAWYDVDTATGGTDTLIAVVPLFREVRVDTTGVLTGTPVAHLVGLDRRTD